MRKFRFSAVITVLMASVFLFTGCFQSLKDLGKYTGGATGNLDSKANKNCIAGFEAIKRRDEDELKRIFSQNTVDKKEIVYLISCITGDIENYSESGEPMSTHFGNSIEDYHMFVKEYSNVTTSEGKEYRIQMVACAASKYDEDDIGIQYVALYSDSELLCKAGRLIERYDEQKIPKVPVDVDFSDRSYAQGVQAFSCNLLYYLKSGDEEGFASLFSGEHKYTADDTFEHILEEIGEIKTYSQIDISAEGELDDDHWTKLADNLDIYDIVNADGERFEIHLYVIYVDENDPDMEGIHFFQIERVDDELNGEFEHDYSWMMQFGNVPE